MENNHPDPAVWPQSPRTTTQHTTRIPNPSPCAPLHHLSTLLILLLVLLILLLVLLLILFLILFFILLPIIALTLPTTSPLRTHVLVAIDYLPLVFTGVVVAIAWLAVLLGACDVLVWLIGAGPSAAHVLDEMLEMLISTVVGVWFGLGLLFVLAAAVGIASTMFLFGAFVVYLLCRVVVALAALFGVVVEL